VPDLRVSVISAESVGRSDRRKTSARRSKAGSTVGLLFLVIVGAIIAAVKNVVDSIGGTTILVLLLAGIATVVFLAWQRKKKRFEALSAKYGNAAIAERIMRKQFWQGQTSSQLSDALGDPMGVDRKILRNETREVWKYNPRGSNRYGLRITLEDDIVVGWDQKS
jgi:hypothetical protein